MNTPNAEPLAEHSTEKWAVLLIHGVGDTKPGNLLAAVGEALIATNPGLDLPAGNEVLTLPDGPTGAPPTFLVRTQTDARDPDDERRRGPLVGPNACGLDTHQFVASVVRFVFGIRHLVRQAALIPGPCGWALNARPAVLLLQGPIYALFLYEVYLAFLPDAWDEPPISRTASPSAQAVVAAYVTAASGLWWRTQFRGRRRSVLFPSLVGVSLRAFAPCAVFSF